MWAFEEACGAGESLLGLGRGPRTMVWYEEETNVRTRTGKLVAAHGHTPGSWRNKMKPRRKREREGFDHYIPVHHRVICQGKMGLVKSGVVYYSATDV